MDALKLLGELLGGKQIPSRSGRRVLQSAHPAFRQPPTHQQQAHAHPQQRQTSRGVLGGILGTAAHQYGQRAGHLDPGHCDDPYGGHSQHEANQRAAHLIRAMISASKADGRIDFQEEQQITREFGGRLAPDEVQFVRREYARPIDVCDLARDTPRGLEDDVYVASLVAIDLDTNAEAQYLHQLAHELRLSHDYCNELHQRYGEPVIFQ